MIILIEEHKSSKLINFKIIEMKITEKNYTIDDGKNVNAYYVKLRGCEEIKLPLTNIKELMNYMYKEDKTRIILDDTDMTQEIKYKKFEIFIKPEHVKQMSKSFFVFKKKIEKIDIDIKLGYGNFKDISGNQLSKTKIVLDFGFNVPQIYNDEWKSASLFINGMRLFKIDDTYFTNLVISRIAFSNDNLDQYSISSYTVSINTSKPIMLTEINKIKKEYKSYVASVKKQVKTTNFEIFI